MPQDMVELLRLLFFLTSRFDSDVDANEKLEPKATLLKRIQANTPNRQ